MGNWKTGSEHCNRCPVHDRTRTLTKLQMCGQRVLKIVGMFSSRGDFDGHLSRDAFQLATPGFGDDGDPQLWDAACHGTAVLQHETAGAAMKSSCDLFDGDVPA